MQSRARFTFLQHPREARNPIGTARMAHLSLPGSDLLTGVDFSAHERFLQLLDDPSREHVVLYPAPGARPAMDLVQRAGNLHVWVIDGTWWQARKLWNKNPRLHAMPAYILNPTEPGQYKIRKEPAPHCLSTVEAVGQLLDALDGTPNRHVDILKPFHAMVDKQVAFASAPNKVSRHVRKVRITRKRPMPAELVEAGENLLLVHGESNAWPAHRTDCPPIELFQWDALRPATGERFHAIIQVDTLAPNALAHMKLTPAHLDGAIPLAEFMARWAAFLRPQDVWCTWGFYTSGLLKTAGGNVEHLINLQHIINTWVHKKTGTVERAHEGTDAPAPETPHPGRGAHRLAQMDALVRWLGTQAAPAEV